MSKRPKLGEFTTEPSFISLLENTNVMQIRPESNLTYVCTKEDTVLDVWKGLNRHHFMSVPVLANKEKYEGFIDLADIVGFFAAWFSVNTIRKYPSISELLAVDEAFKKITIEKMMVAPGQQRSQFVPVKNTFSLLYCMEILARENIERIPIINESGILFNFLTQSHIVEFLSKNMDKIGGKKNKPVNDMANVIKQVFSISQDQLAFEAFIQMNKEKVHGLAVVDEKYQVVGAVSVRDLKLIIEEKVLSYLLEPIKMFLGKLQQDSANSNFPRPSEPITVKREDTLGTVLDLLVKHKLHRVFVVDNKKKPIGVVGLKEVLLEIIQN
jgi:CBS domain-containing protein